MPLSSQNRRIVVLILVDLPPFRLGVLFVLASS
jgi:hypothetical protein